MTPLIDISIGCDIVETSRLKRMMEQQEAIKKVFHPSELIKFESEHLAGLFAVKEAAFKALGLKNTPWLSIEVKHTPHGKPLLILSKDLNRPDIISLDCSIAHDGGYAFAVVSILQEKIRSNNII